MSTDPNVRAAVEELSDDEFRQLTARAKREGTTLLQLDQDTFTTWLDELGSAAEDQPQAVAADDGDYAEMAGFADDVLRLSYGGHRYRVPACSIEMGELAFIIVNGKRDKASSAVRERIAAMDEAQLYRAMLGGDTDSPLYDPATDVYEQLAANGATWKVVEHFANTAMMWAVSTEEYAREYFTLARAVPKELPPIVKELQGRRAPARKAGASSTRSRVSGSSTPRKRATKATRGASSSSSGR